MSSPAHARPLDILLNLPHGGTDSPLLQSALFVAQRLGARLDALCVTAMPAPTFTVPETVTFQIEEAGQRRREAEAHGDWYQRTLAAHGLDGRWKVAQGDEVQTICHVAAGYDLLVLQRGETGEPAPIGFGTVSRCVFGSHVPVLVIPEQTRTTTPGRKILLAWNGSREAALAARGALPLLRGAERVLVLEGVNEQSWDPMAPPQLDLEDWLSRRGIDAEVRPFDPSSAPGPALLEAAHEMDADLIVMGAWGRSRISEMVLGGTTRHLFMESDIPMLVAH